jgi:arsenite-transporting ATPase
MVSFSSSPSLLANPDSGFSLCKRSGKIKMLRRTTATPPSITAASLNDNDDQSSSSKLVTFIGKGGSGKTTSAIFAAQVLLSLNSCYST